LKIYAEIKPNGDCPQLTVKAPSQRAFTIIDHYIEKWSIGVILVKIGAYSQKFGYRYQKIHQTL
jgi:hypothetical protein